MKILTKEEEAEHYQATLIGGIGGGAAGVAAGSLGVWAASARYPAFRSLTLPLRAFLITSTGTFAAIVSADSYSRRFEASRNPNKNYEDSASAMQDQIAAQRSGSQKISNWFSSNRYGVVFGSWVASMGIALGLVGRNPYLTGAQKLVQARVYAQGLTIAVVIISLAFEGTDSAQGRGRWETVKVLDPKDPEHKHMIEKKIHHEKYAGEDQWMDMVAAEEERIKDREDANKQSEQHSKKQGKGKKDTEHAASKADQHVKVEQEKEKK